ncbi:hypothetical protein BKA61DRAFT_739656 [Leptodontidium sp. MPI-SDFR-AT-0119]|nr:hypothetical protein BKA61DRAFT_739656 [Leptodontidium sp. MPI-SDFR-AT-0119]
MSLHSPFNHEDFFGAYLSEIDPSQSYVIEAVTGGLVNWTSRATKLPCSSPGKFGNHKSLILKYAPPYIAAIGESAKFSPYRQTIEAQALALFGPSGNVPNVAAQSQISVPDLLHYDASAHVLIMSDLGRLHNLTQRLHSLQTQSLVSTLKSLTQELEVSYSQIGTRLGSFFAALHSQSTISTIGSSRLSIFQNPDARTAVYENNVAPIEEFLHHYSFEDSAELAARVTADFHAIDGNQVFSFGDAWSGAVILSNDEGPDSQPTTGVVDWEFANIGRGLNGDMAQLLADLHSYLLEYAPGEVTYVAVKALMKGISSSYRQRRRITESEWEIGVLRSAFILHGRELIVAGATAEEKTEECRKVKVKKGVWYLRTASKDISEFEAGKWREDEVLIGLVLGD